MWIFTTRGFYSAVQHKQHPDLIVVRARCEEDIRALHDIVPTATDPVEWAGTDYQWRITCTRDEWHTAMMYLAMDVDYTNFKNAVKSKKHSNAYMGVWSMLLTRLQGGRMYKNSHRYGSIDRDEWSPPHNARQSAAAFMETSAGWDALGNAMDDLDDEYLLEDEDLDFDALMREIP